MDKLSVTVYSRGPRCNGNCHFCAWNSDFEPLASEDRSKLTIAGLSQHLAFAQAQPRLTVVELMDGSVAMTSKSLSHYLELGMTLPPGYGINPGICLNQDRLEALRNAGAGYYGNNLETSPRLFPQLVGTHTQAAKLRSLQLARDIGLKIHTGFLLGLGETEADWLEMFKLVDDLQPDGLNLNFFYPAKGLPLAEGFRFPHPDTVQLWVERWCQLFRGIPIYLGAGRRSWLQHRLQEVERCVDGIYVKRFLNHEALPLAG
jgi:biotin synthase-like enzyme